MTQPDETLKRKGLRMMRVDLVACVDNHDWVEDDGFNRMEFDAHYCCECGTFRSEVEAA